MSTPAHPYMVRLKPYNKNKGNLRRRYGIPHGPGVVFEEGRWHNVSKTIADAVAVVTNRDYKPETGPAFDVLTLDEFGGWQTAQRELVTKGTDVNPIVVEPPPAAPVAEPAAPEPTPEPEPVEPEAKTDPDVKKDVEDKPKSKYGRRRPLD